MFTLLAWFSNGLFLKLGVITSSVCFVSVQGLLIDWHGVMCDVCVCVYLKLLLIVVSFFICVCMHV